MATDNSGTLALLIDGDNASPKIVVGLMAEIANYGTASVKRIYGDWTGPNLKGWKECLLEHSIQPIQQFAYTTGKNATDGAMIIDAMDLLYTGRFSGFCIVSSDSDFARLAARIREQAVTVYGFGERKTPRPFITACDKFVYFDVLNGQADEIEEAVAPAPKPEAVKPAAAKVPPKRAGLNKAAREMLVKAVRATADEDGRANLARVGDHLAKQAPDFDARNYGFPRLSDLVIRPRHSRTSCRQSQNNPGSAQGSPQGERVTRKFADIAPYCLCSGPRTTNGEFGTGPCFHGRRWAGWREVVATYKLFNINRTKLEHVLHRVLTPARLDLTPAHWRKQSMHQHHAPCLNTCDGTVR